MLAEAKLKEQLRSIGLRDGMDLLVHSSLKRVGPVDGGADTIIDALRDAIGPSGTLMMSTVSGNVTPDQTIFHVLETPSSVGALSNVFRKRPGAIRSLHPVHSIAAMGPKATFFTEGHLEATTPWSPDSPYGKLMRNNGSVLFLGTNFSANTCIHAIEIEARVSGLYKESTTALQIIGYDGEPHELKHHWHAPKRAFYVDLEHFVERAGGLTYGQIGNGISRLVDAAILRETLLPLFRETPELAIVRLTDSSFVWE
ncbi:MAG: AAC(3) family N-acetyltransferase [Lentisphaerae bacterium]|nr:AAC(3) family N-acetyltransferase [Lentisphaerota bacterium]MBT4814251.1 AAC(3) family N-acetyltransferase [Lentisphaerota bacterium]MBT5610973.1 AAC(3) family N-acetyltransferase [Lentisphaerota bacterium]MBT7058058.1 AAC(3) family N-acetyltransferase [Lentisphaerota bacterium]MBT7848069.1 AAC(3) family N-acetyltransferase [Lentisphaerota bacterium]